MRLYLPLPLLWLILFWYLFFSSEKEGSYDRFSFLPALLESDDYDPSEDNILRFDIKAFVKATKTKHSRLREELTKLPSHLWVGVSNPLGVALEFGVNTLSGSGYELQEKQNFFPETDMPSPQEMKIPFVGEHTGADRDHVYFQFSREVVSAVFIGHSWNRIQEMKAKGELKVRFLDEDGSEIDPQEDGEG